jgi:large repetitive protein
MKSIIIRSVVLIVSCTSARCHQLLRQPPTRAVDHDDHDDDADTRGRALQQLESVLGTIVKLRLINASIGNRGQPLVDPLVDGAVINLADFPPNPLLSMEAVRDSNSATAPIGSVRFAFAGRSNFRMDNSIPYSLCGDNRTVFTACTQLVVGSYNVTVTPFQSAGATGAVGTPSTFTFSIVNVISTPTPAAWVEVVAPPNATTYDARHEACFVMVGRKAYLLAGRGRKPVNIYDPVSRTWTNGATPPMQIHHSQCVVADDKIWIVSSWTGGYPRETNTPCIYVSKKFFFGWFGPPQSRWYDC